MGDNTPGLAFDASRRATRALYTEKDLGGSDQNAIYLVSKTWRIPPPFDSSYNFEPGLEILRFVRVAMLDIFELRIVKYRSHLSDGRRRQAPG